MGTMKASKPSLIIQNKGTCEQQGGFLCITAFGVGKKIPLCPLLLFLSLHPHTLPNQGWRDHMCTCRRKALRTGGMCTHTCGAGMCVCECV